MAVNINLNLKTINSQPISGSGDMVINTINWRGSFPVAPNSPAKYDAYHNTTDGNSHIYDGTTWDILAQKGDDSNSSSGMFFPHETLTSDDVGKLVIWKDGKAQLPVFETASEAQSGIVRFKYNKPDFHLPSIPYFAEIALTEQPIPFNTFSYTNNIDPFGLTYWRTFTFVSESPGSEQVLIGTNTAETVANLVDSINAYSDALVYANQSGSSFTIEYNTLALTINEPVNIVENVAHLSLPDCMSLTDSTQAYRMADTLSGYYILRGLMKGGVTMPDNINDDIGLLIWYFNNPEHTYEVAGIGTDGAPVRKMTIADSLSEFRMGLVYKLKEVDGIEDAYFEGQYLYIEHLLADIDFESPIDPLLYNGEWENLEVEAVPTAPIPTHCKYPILGLVKSIQENQVEIYTEPICEFKLTGAMDITWENTYDLQRYCVLNPDAPGYLMSLANVPMTSPLNFFMVAEAGYIAATNKEITSGENFHGAFSLDQYALSLFKFAITQEDD